MNIQFLFCRRLENIFFWSSNKITKSIFWQLTHCKNYFVLLWFINKIFKDSKMADYVSTYLPTVRRTMDMNNCFKHDWFWLLSWGSSEKKIDVKMAARFRGFNFFCALNLVTKPMLKRYVLHQTVDFKLAYFSSSTLFGSLRT